MDLWLIRHAVAAGAEPDAPDDPRPLTESGRRKFKKAVRGLKRLGITFDRIAHSPKLRAADTAEILLPCLDADPEGREGTEVTELLAREPSPELMRFLEEKSAFTLALVGHQPWLGALASWLVTGDVAHEDRFPLEKGGAMHLIGEPRPAGMAIVASLSPKLLRKL